MLFDVNRLFGKDPNAVKSALGTPDKTSDVGSLHVCHYVKSGAKIEVQFENRKAVAFIVSLPVPVDTPERALALLGVDVRRRAPAEKSPISTVFRGKFGHPGIKQVSAIKAGRGYKDVCVQNEEE